MIVHVKYDFISKIFRYQNAAVKEDFGFPMNIGNHQSRTNIKVSVLLCLR